MFWIILIVCVAIYLYVSKKYKSPKPVENKTMIISTKGKNNIVFKLTAVHVDDIKYFIINFCKKGDLVSLEFEPDNIYDPDAIKVLHFNTHIGYVPRFETNEVKEFINKYDYHAFIYSKNLVSTYLDVEIALVEK